MQPISQEFHVPLTAVTEVFTLTLWMRLGRSNCLGLARRSEAIAGYLCVQSRPVRVHLVARAMDSVASDEHRSTASALTSVRSIGTAFGAAIAWVVAKHRRARRRYRT